MISHSLVFLLSVLCALPFSSSAPSQAGISGGSFAVTLDGKPAGWERFEITSAANRTIFKSTGENSLSGSTRSLATTTEVSDGKPKSYSLEVTEGGKLRKYAIGFTEEGAQIRVEAGGRTSERAVRLAPGVVLLDRDVWHHYQQLLSKFQPGVKRQRFRIFSPQAALREMSADVELTGTTNFGSGSNKRKANRFLVLLAGGFEVKIIADDQGFPLQIEVPSLETKVILNAGQDG
jgi:hypothetical protein